MPILAVPYLMPYANLAGIVIGSVASALGLKALSDKVQVHMEENPEKARKIFSIIMPEQGIAALFNEAAEGEGEEIIDLDETKLSGKEKEKEMSKEAQETKGSYQDKEGKATGSYGSKRGRMIRRAEELGLADKDLKDNYDPNKKKFNWKRFTRNKADGGMAGDKTYHQYHDQTRPMDLEGIMGYAHGGDIAVQGGVKNYLGEQKMVTVPQKWQSAEDHPQTELAYITNREKNLLLKKDLHDSLKGGANKGPEGVMSLNGWGDAPGGSKGGGKGGSSGGNNRFADYSYNKAERYATPKGVPIGPGGLRVGQGGNTTGALGTTGTGSNIDFVDQKYSGDGIFSGYRNLDKFGQPKMGLAYGLDRLKNFIPGLMGMAMGIPGVGLATNFLKNKFGKGVVEEEQTISPYQLNSLGKYVYNEDPKNMFTDNFSDQKINNVKANVTSPNGELIELGNNFANPGGLETPPASEYEGMWGNDLQNSMEQDYGMYEAPPPASEYEGMWGNDLQNSMEQDYGMYEAPPPASEYEGMWGNDLQNSMEQDYGMYVPSYPSGNPGGTTNSNFANPGGTTNSNFANPGGDTFPYQKSVNNAAMEIMSNAYKDRYHNFANPGGTTNSNFAIPGGTTNSNFANPGGTTNSNFAVPGGITSITNNELPGNNIVAGNYSQNAVSNQLYGKDYDLLDPFDQQKLDSLIDQVGTKSTGELARNGGMMGVGSMFVNKR